MRTLTRSRCSLRTAIVGEATSEPSVEPTSDATLSPTAEPTEQPRLGGRPTADGSSSPVATSEPSQARDVLFVGILGIFAAAVWSATRPRRNAARHRGSP
jgi:hypothetical protein